MASKLTSNGRVELLKMAERLTDGYAAEDEEERTLEDRMDLLKGVYQDLVEMATDTEDNESDDTSEDS